MRIQHQMAAVTKNTSDRKVAPVQHGRDLKRENPSSEGCLVGGSAGCGGFELLMGF